MKIYLLFVPGKGAEAYNFVVSTCTQVHTPMYIYIYTYTHVSMSVSTQIISSVEVSLTNGPKQMSNLFSEGCKYPLIQKP